MIVGRFILTVGCTIPYAGIQGYIKWINQAKVMNAMWPIASNTCHLDFSLLCHGGLLLWTVSQNKHVLSKDAFVSHFFFLQSQEEITRKNSDGCYNNNKFLPVSSRQTLQSITTFREISCHGDTRGISDDTDWQKELIRFWLFFIIRKA